MVLEKLQLICRTLLDESIGYSEEPKLKGNVFTLYGPIVMPQPKQSHCTVVGESACHSASAVQELWLDNHPSFPLYTCMRYSAQWNWNLPWFKMSHGPPKSGRKHPTTAQCMITSAPILLWGDLSATKRKIPSSVLASSSKTWTFNGTSPDLKLKS